MQERIAVALLQLQRDMHSVLNRLTTLETITIARQQVSRMCNFFAFYIFIKVANDLGPKSFFFTLKLRLRAWSCTAVLHF